MTADLAELYRDVTLDHGRRPRNFRTLMHPNRSAEGVNPLCGDRVKMELRVSGDRVEDAAFTGAGCAICMASASMLTEAIRNEPVSRALTLFATFRDLLTRDEAGPAGPATRETLGKLMALEGVRRFPMRIKCATLPWHTMRTALDTGEASYAPPRISTE